MKKCKILITGCSRGTSYSDLSFFIKDFIHQCAVQNPVIVNGYENSDDREAIRYAIENDLHFSVYLASKTFKKGTRTHRVAQIIRNEKMVSQCQRALILWNDKDQNIRDIIEWCEKKKVPHKVIRLGANIDKKLAEWN